MDSDLLTQITEECVVIIVDPIGETHIIINCETTIEQEHVVGNLIATIDSPSYVLQTVLFLEICFKRLFYYLQDKLGKHSDEP